MLERDYPPQGETPPQTEDQKRLLAQEPPVPAIGFTEEQQQKENEAFPLVLSDT